MTPSPVTTIKKPTISTTSSTPATSTAAWSSGASTGSKETEKLPLRGTTFGEIHKKSYFDSKPSKVCRKFGVELKSGSLTD